MVEGTPPKEWTGSGSDCRYDLTCVGFKRCTKMAKLLRMSSRSVAYLPSLRNVLQRLRATSASPSALTAALTSGEREGPTVERTLPMTTEAVQGLARGFPLPGSTALAGSDLPPESLFEPPVGRAGEGSSGTMALLDTSRVEVSVSQCPEFLREGFLLLFPGESVEALSVMTITEHTHNDMTSWSSAVEAEREELAAHFIESAKEICSRLQAAGHWADFIDPTSGRAFFAAHSNHTLQETDERFVHFGFEVLDLGCCRCIYHPQWGTHTFLGTIFTSAPTDASSITGIMELGGAATSTAYTMQH